MDAHGNTGTVGYSYDNVGNRQQRTSSVTAVPMQNFSGQYDFNDRLTASGYVYDSNGSTTTDPNGTYLYDALGRMTSATVGGVTTTYIYDADGNKVSQTVGGVTTNFLIDSNNLTGYAQVLEEQQGGSVNRVYSYGTSRISEDQLISSTWTLNYYGYDGQGSVRYLTDNTGTISDTYDYDAFGILINQTHTGTPTPNVFLYDGEENNPNGLYYLRARYMDEGIGRFQSMDGYEGDQDDPLSLHKYQFTSNNPTNEIDPSGNDLIDEEPVVYWPANDLNNRSYHHNYSDLGLRFTKSWEVYEEYPYDHDGARNATQGYGHLLHRGPLTPQEVKDNKNHVGGWSVPKANDQLQIDTSASADDINSMVQVPLAQYEFDALVDFRFSIGRPWFIKAILLSDINSGKYSYVPGDFSHFLRSNGIYVPGLFNRRCAEADIFSSGKYQLAH